MLIFPEMYSGWRTWCWKRR